MIFSVPKANRIPLPVMTVAEFLAWCRLPYAMRLSPLTGALCRPRVRVKALSARC